MITKNKLDGWYSPKIKLSARAKWHLEMSRIRKSWREMGYTTVPYKSYFSFGIRERGTIRENFQPNSNMNKWITASRGNHPVTSMMDYPFSFRAN